MTYILRGSKFYHGDLGFREPGDWREGLERVSVWGLGGMTPVWKGASRDGTGERERRTPTDCPSQRTMRQRLTALSVTDLPIEGDRALHNIGQQQIDASTAFCTDFH